MIRAAWLIALALSTNGIYGAEEPAIPSSQPREASRNTTESQTCCDQQQRLRPNRDFGHVPPVPQKATITILKPGPPRQNALLTLEFEKDEKLGSTLTLWTGDRKAILKKRGDGNTFSGVVDFDIAEFKAEQIRRTAGTKEGNLIPVFDSRELIRKEKVQRFDFERFRNIITIDRTMLTSLVAGNPGNIDPRRELMITDLSVVNDPARTFDVCTNTGTPMGMWTFGHLMAEMANQPITGIDPSDFVLHWLSSWEHDQTVNGFTVPNRSKGLQSLINEWPKLSNGKLDLSKAPFLLLAIVNRLDLRTNSAYGGGGGDAGEARFVFGGTIPGGLPPCIFPGMTVIFEYGIKKSNCAQVHAWAQQWHNLGSIALGPPFAFNAALQAITDQFTVAGADPAKPNGSTVNQIRTNEVRFGSPWELREFNILSSGQLETVPVKQTPSSGPTGPQDLKNTAVIRDYINQFEADILHNRYKVPLTFPPGTPFLGGSSINNFDVWNGPATINNNDARHKFSLGTCNGCHGAERDPLSPMIRFFHLEPRNGDAESEPSDFLWGKNPRQDPISGVNRLFADLFRRQADLDSLVSSSCNAGGVFRELFFSPLNMTH